jgi:hypothetical protein
LEVSENHPKDIDKKLIKVRGERIIEVDELFIFQARLAISPRVEQGVVLTPELNQRVLERIDSMAVRPLNQGQREWLRIRTLRGVMGDISERELNARVEGAFALAQIQRIPGISRRGAVSADGQLGRELIELNDPQRRGNPRAIADRVRIIRDELNNDIESTFGDTGARDLGIADWAPTRNATQITMPNPPRQVDVTRPVQRLSVALNNGTYTLEITPMQGVRRVLPPGEIMTEQLNRLLVNPAGYGYTLRITRDSDYAEIDIASFAQAYRNPREHIGITDIEHTQLIIGPTPVSQWASLAPQAQTPPVAYTPRPRRSLDELMADATPRMPVQPRASPVPMPVVQPQRPVVSMRMNFTREEVGLPLESAYSTQAQIAQQFELQIPQRGGGILAYTVRIRGTREEFQRWQNEAVRTLASRGDTNPSNTEVFYQLIFGMNANIEVVRNGRVLGMEERDSMLASLSTIRDPITIAYQGETPWTRRS